MTRPRSFAITLVGIYLCSTVTDAFSPRCAGTDGLPTGHGRRRRYGSAMTSESPLVLGIKNRACHRKGESREIHRLRANLSSSDAHDKISTETAPSNSSRIRGLSKIPVAIALMILISKRAAHGAVTGKSMSAATAAVASITRPPLLRAPELAIASSMVVVVSVVMRFIGLSTLSHQILIAASRMSIQLLIVGTFVLDLIFGKNEPLVVVGWLAFVGLIASREASSRNPYKFDKMERYCRISTFSGVGVALAMTIAFVLKNRPWWDARAVVPIAGMLFGNCLSAVSLALKALLAEFSEGRDRIELRLARGAKRWEATLPLVQTALSSALMPTVNAMSATGIVHMPGMMTGQILGGQSPSGAAAYQVMIYFSICAASCTSVLVLTALVLNRMFDYRSHRLLSEEEATLSLVKKKGDIGSRIYNGRWRNSITETLFSFLRPNGKSKRKQDNYLNSVSNNATDAQVGETASLAVNNTYSFLKTDAQTSPPSHKSKKILHIDNLVVSRTNLTVSIDLHAGERIGITGRSGIGKTQLLRTIARLDKSSGGNISLHDKDIFSIKPSRWRSSISWLSQDRPTLTGTPNTFYDQILNFRSQTKDPANHSAMTEVTARTATPAEIASAWFLSESVFDRPWNTLSGGEAQRANLAITLALEPDVLLLDEPTSACDSVTTLAIEKTLEESEVPILLVSHDIHQIERFCSCQIQLT